MFVFGQFRTVTLGRSGENLKSFPQKAEFDFFYYYTAVPYLSKKNTETAKWEVFPNPEFEGKNVHGAYPFDGVTWTHFQEENAPPLLDSLSDGTYAYYYNRIGYLDGDTLKFNEKVIYALVPISRNEVNGAVRWYYPNGLLMQESEYLNGIKNGATFFQEIEYDFETKSFLQESADTKNYKQNLLHGERVYLATRTDYENRSKPKPTYLKKMSYVNDSIDGPLEITLNNQNLISGTYAMGRAIGKWQINHWYWERSNVKIYPKYSFEINSDSNFTTTPFFNRTKMDIEVQWTNSTDFERNNVHYADYNYRDSDYFSGEYPNDNETNFINSFDYLMSIPNCRNYTSNYSKTKPNNYRPSSSHSLRNEEGILVSDQSIIDTCGVHFDYKNYTEYYKNGEIRSSFDFTKPAELYKSKVYYENGKVMNEVLFSDKDQLFHQYWYDNLGKILQHSTHNQNGSLRLVIENAFTKVIDGKLHTYSSATNSWFYNYSGNISTTGSQDYVIQSDYRESDLSVLRKHTYSPLARKGIILVVENNGIYKHKTHYSISADYKTISFSDTIKIGDFETTSSYRTDGGLSKQDWLLLEENKILPLSYLTSLQLNYKQDKVQLPVTLQSEIYTGDFRIIKSNKTKVKASKHSATLYLNTDVSAVLLDFLDAINTNIYSNGNKGFNPRKVLPVDFQEELSLKRILFSLQEGKAVGTIEHFAENGFLLYQANPASDQTKWFNNYSETINFNVFNEFMQEHGVTPFLSESFVNTAQLYERVHFYPNGDTLLYDSRNYATKHEKHLTVDFIGKKVSEYQNDRVVYLKKYEFLYEYEFVDTLIFEYNEDAKLCKYYDNKGETRVNFTLKNGLVDSIITYELGQIEEIAVLNNGYLETQNYYMNGVLVNSQEIFAEDSVKPDLQHLPSELDRQLFSWYKEAESGIYGLSSRNYQEEYQRSQTSKYQNERMVEQGVLDNGEKIGIWIYTYPNIPKYTIDFSEITIPFDGNTDERSIAMEISSDRSEKNYKITIGSICFYDTTNQIISKGVIFDWNSEYSCLQQNYTEQYNIEYSLYNGKPNEGTSYNIVNYYPNGNKMNEGLIVNGKPEGLWKWYHSDGLLYEVGKYQQGIREGRWLKGDLSKVRFTGEMCLDTESEDFKAISRQIEVEINYFKDGEVEYSESHELETGN